MARRSSGPPPMQSFFRASFGVECSGGGGSRARGEIGVFFSVAKKIERLRIIFGSRLFDAYFRGPPSTRLPAS
eukprot:9054095-Pyramimonas_sp.AAC.1